MVDITESSHQAPFPKAGTPLPSTGAVHIPINAFGASLSLFFAITYVLCVLYGLIVTDQGMHQLMPLVLPGFTWLDWPSFLLGLVEIVVYGWYTALIFGLLFNFLATRLR
jgi:hypothetical protein